jgi:hypothetical protein
MPIRPIEGNVVPPRHDPARRARVARRVATPAARAVTVLAALLGLSAPAAAQAPAAPMPAAPTPAAPTPAAPTPAAPAPAAPTPDITAAPTAPIAPPGGAVMPIPQGYYRPPPSLPPWANPWRIAYEPGDPIPRGYALETRADRSLVGAGIATFSVPYAISFTIAGVATLVDDGDDGEEFAPLFIPFVGPMIALSTLEAEDSGVFWLTVNAVAQMGGLLLFAAGLANEDVYLERQVQAGHAPYAPPVLLGLPRTLPYKDGAPAPHGYRLETQMNRKLARAGAIVLGSSWALAALTAGTVLSEGSSESESYAPLLVPVAGPFITLGTGEDIDFSDGDGRLSGALVLVDGLAQATGLALLVAGLVANQKVWVRDDIPREASLPAPEILVGPTGGTLRFRF